jgi:diguanylate cyclase (GGDEF)-like protein
VRVSLDEVLYESDRTRVVRAPLPDGSGHVVFKQPRGARAAERLRHELSILERLDGVDGVPRLAGVPAPAGTLALADRPARPLSATTTPWPVPPLLELARALAEVLAGVHRRGVVHKDISPANILLAAGGRPVLIDFDLATTFAERPAFAHETGLAGTLPYLAPEQTGRTGRAVDHRADLYGLGATLYELATGEPPFGRDGDALRLVHDHLARIPVPPAERNGELPAGLSDVIMRLLRKEPDQRYQSAEGLGYDLARIGEAGGARFELGQRDFPLRLTPPARLVGRDGEIAALRGLLASAVAGRGGVAMVTGAPGVGKTALIDELRPAVAVAGGWFVSGKFDQYRRDLGADAVWQAFGVLGGLLLAEPEEELAGLRTRLLAALGANAGLAAGAMPGFGSLLGVPAEEIADDPRKMQARVRQVGIDVLRAVAGQARPVVMFIDDLQWAGPAAIGFLDAVLTEPDLPGLLVVGTYRETEVDETHPLTSVLARLRRPSGPPRELRLANLPLGELGALLAEMLRLPAADAAPLAEAIGARTDGNPYDTVELVNALRREGALVPAGDGWHWDAGTLRRYVGRGDVVDLLNTRIDALPVPACQLLEVMACLGGDVALETLGVAAALLPHEMDRRLLPALEDGLVVLERTPHPVARFRHDRVQQAAYGRLEPRARAVLRLSLARRLAARPEHALAAAHQYLPALDELSDPDERREVAWLLRGAATAARTVTNHTAAECFLAAAIRVLDPTDAAYRELEAEWHAELYSLGRLDEADELYRSLERAGIDPVRHNSSACVQISSLTNRGQAREAVTLGIAHLRRLGVAVPAPAEVGEQVFLGLDALYDWVATGSADGDIRLPEITDARLIAIARTINRLLPPAFFSDQTFMAWLVIEASRLWAEHGPAAVLVGPLSHAAFVTIAVRDDYRTGYDAVRRVLAVGEARGYEPDTSQARFLHALGTAAWFEPLEASVRLGHQARDGLLQGGDLQNACSTYYATVPQMLDCAADLDALSVEVEAALALCARTGNDHAAMAFVAYRQLIRALRGETAPPGSLTDDSFDEAAHLDALVANPTAAANVHIARALSAAIVADADGLARHAAAVRPLLGFIQATYGWTSAHVLGALACAGRARDAEPGARDAALAELDGYREWLAARAADQPGNFRHLVRLVDAERAWSVGDFAAAAVAFDEAQHDVAGRQRPWHAALITERAGLFSLAHGMPHAGARLLADARQAYAAWGAHGKVRQLEREHALPAPATVGTPVVTTQSMSVSTEMIDMLAVLEASRVLSSETDLDRLRARVVEVLSAMTGATAVRVVLWDDASEGWVLPAEAGVSQRPLPLPEAAARRLVPLSALRYAERTREPMVVDDAARDDRVSRDPYVAGIEHCSLLVVPVLSQGVPRAMLLLENRLSRHAFSAGRLDSVMLIAGQLTVSIDNALVYASLERKVAERTEELADANQRLEQLTVTDALTGLANRRRLTEVLDGEWRRSLRSGQPVGLAMIDIDNFKLYNDHYGHMGGDTCLRTVAAALRGSVRGTDLVARYGGEEFCVVMPNADAEGARAVAERARAGGGARDEPHAAVPSGIVTISVGVTTGTPDAGGDGDQLIKVADAALYEAKRGGRNRVASGNLIT